MIDLFRKQYINFKSLIKSPPTFGDPLMTLSKKIRLNEGENRKTFDVGDVKETIIKNYKLEDFQFTYKVRKNDTLVILIVPHLGENEDLIVNDMESLGYYKTSQKVMDIEDMKYTLIGFDDNYNHKI